MIQRRAEKSWLDAPVNRQHSSAAAAKIAATQSAAFCRRLLDLVINAARGASPGHCIDAACYTAHNFIGPGPSVLLELRVENYAIIDNVAVEFAPGLNLLSGETGAGKSILIDALALLLGGKASTDAIRYGTDKAVVSAVFDADTPALGAALESDGIDLDQGHLILRREVAAGGKGRVFVNNQPATVAVLRQLAPHLAVIHAQNEAVLAFDAGARLMLLDSFADVDGAAVAAAYQTWDQVGHRIADLERDEHDRLRLLDLWSYQRKEIADAQLQGEEDAKLEAEKRVLANSERVYGAAMAAYDVLYESNTSGAASIRAAARQIEDLSRFDAKFRETLTELESARITVEDIGQTLRGYAAGVEASPERLAEVERAAGRAGSPETQVWPQAGGCHRAGG